MFLYVRKQIEPKVDFDLLFFVCEVMHALDKGRIGTAAGLLNGALRQAVRV